MQNQECSANAYVNTILTRIKNLLSQKRISQKEFAELCNISPSIVSKLLAGKSTLTIKLIYIMCQALGVSPEILLASNEEARSVCTNSNSDDDLLISDPKHRAFHGIINNRYDEKDYYYFYSKPTISNEKAGFLSGKLRLTPSDDNSFCTAKLIINTGKQDLNGFDIKKEFIGDAVISLPMRSCCISLNSPHYADLGFLVFSHMFLNNEKLLTRLVGCLTISAGANRRPVFEKAIITRVPLSNESLKELEGQLFINSSSILIDKEVLDSKISDSQDNVLQKLLTTADIDLSKFEQKYYHLEESQIRCAQHLTSDEKLKLINALRGISSSPYYAKVSGRSDELLFEYISKLELDNQKSSQN